MKIAIVSILIFVLVIFFLYKGKVRSKQTSESKLGILEHPATFKKPLLEMVSGSGNKNDEKKTSSDND